MTATLETAPAPTVHEAIDTRKSVRAFLPDPVDPTLLREILTTASRAASGGNLQPWRLYVLAGAARDALVEAVAEKQKETPFGDGPEYPIYPPDLTEPYKTRRGEIAKQMYALVGIGRDDAVGRAKQMQRNFEFFGAPIGMVLTIDRQMGPPQFCDLGLFLGNLMLLAREHGLHTCPQEAWSLWGKTIREVVGVPDHELVFCGISLGWADDQDPINALRSERAPLDDFASFQGL
ncbi:MAG: nitroreductase [Myxococcales bacterium]|nr:nitroreductase [Myxococcales bacterium]